MAVRVKETKPDKSVIKTKVCPHCGATLEYVPNDVQSYHGTDYGGGPDGCTWIDCANCSKQIILKSW
jgi:hypothetical protein